MRKLKLLVSAAVTLALLAVPGAALAKSRDRDHDRMPDKWEKRHNLSTKRKNAKGDPDKDGLANLGEFRSRTRPHDPDSDDDGIEDGDEDRDRDDVDNGNELQEHTSPRDRDSDDDGVNDGDEDRDHDELDNEDEDETGNDPNDDDTDDDGVEDGDEIVGTIATFNAQTGELTITPPSGAAVTAFVTGSTRIECETEDELEDENEADDDRGDDRVVAAHDGDDSSGSNSGPGSGDDSSSSDNSGPGSGDDASRTDNSGPGSTSSGPGPGTEAEHDGDEDNVCTTADLTAGTPVHEAELSLTETGAVWTELEILH